MIVNYVLMYGTPYLKYREFETFEDVSKYLVNKGIVNYSIFKKLEDKEEVEMIYRDNDIEYLKGIIKEVREYVSRIIIDETYTKCILEILDKVEKENDIEFDVLKALNTDLDDDVEMG